MDLPKELVKIFHEIDKEYLNPFMKPEKENSSNNFVHLNQIHNNNEVEYEKIELQRVKTFLSQPCFCGNGCQKLFNEKEVVKARENFRSMSWNEQHCFIIGQLQTFQRKSSKSKSARTTKLRERQKFNYFINADRPVCRTMFLFFHGETLERLKRCQRSLIQVGTISPLHGNTGKKPKHACSESEKENVKLFITNYAAIHGLPDPGRDLRVGQGALKIYLPAIMSYMAIHRIYKESLEDSQKRTVGYHSFRKLWLELAPNIVITKPRSDVCLTCENHRKAINAAIANAEEEKIKCLSKALEHIQKAKIERDYYRHSIKISKESYASIKNRITSGKTSSNETTMHYSWDFAQQVQYPYEDQQVGPIYFKTPRKAQLFGVCCEAIPRQINYLIDEADFTSKNSNMVISLLNHFFENHALGEDNALLTADNCAGQNKNNSVLHYLLYRVMNGLHKKITLSFMLTGHTKFAPDGYFGLIKMKYRRSKIYTYKQMADVIKASTPGGHNICQTYRNKDGSVNFKYKIWSEWLLKYFKKLPNLSKYHHFSFNHESPGIVIAKETVDGKEHSFQLLEDNTFRFVLKKQPQLPLEIIPKGLSSKRMWYLYDNIREYIPNIKDKEITCPYPNIPRPKKEK